MPRLFTSFHFPTEAYERLSAIHDESLAARWVAAEDMHVTLHFLGSIDEAAVPELIRMLGRVEARPFSAKLDRLLAFPHARKARVLACGITAGEALYELHQEMGARLTGEAGFHLERRTYRPHITIARLKPPQDVTHLLASHEVPKMGEVRVGAFHLYESRTTSSGPRYVRLASFPLG